jgi:hypothetical protein
MLWANRKMIHGQIARRGKIFFYSAKHLDYLWSPPSCIFKGIIVDRVTSFQAVKPKNCSSIRVRVKIPFYSPERPDLV